jgi:hypothetical protein
VFATRFSRTPDETGGLTTPEMGAEMKVAPRSTPSSAASSAESRLVPARHVVAAVHGTRTVLLDPRRGHYYGLDEVGGRVWSLASERRSVSEIIQVLADEYEVERAQLESDVAEVLRALKSKGLIEDT